MRMRTSSTARREGCGLLDNFSIMATSSSSRSLEDEVATEIMDVLVVLSTLEDGYSRESPTDRFLFNLKALQCSLFRNMSLRFRSGQ